MRNKFFRTLEDTYYYVKGMSKATKLLIALGGGFVYLLGKYIYLRRLYNNTITNEEVYDYVYELNDDVDTLLNKIDRLEEEIKDGKNKKDN